MAIQSPSQNPEGKSIMVFMLVMVIGCLGSFCALIQNPNQAVPLGSKQNSFLITKQYPNYPKSKTIKPLWSG